MNHLFHTDEEDEERQWLEGMENQDEPEIKEAVRRSVENTFEAQNLQRFRNRGGYPKVVPPITP